MERANIGCLDNRDRISDGKSFTKRGETEKERERAIYPSPLSVKSNSVLGVTISCARRMDYMLIIPKKSLLSPFLEPRPRGLCHLQ